MEHHPTLMCLTRYLDYKTAAKPRRQIRSVVICMHACVLVCVCVNTAHSLSKTPSARNDSRGKLHTTAIKREAQCKNGREKIEKQRW